MQLSHESAGLELFLPAAAELSDFRMIVRMSSSVFPEVRGVAEASVRCSHTEIKVSPGIKQAPEALMENGWGLSETVNLLISHNALLLNPCLY